MKKPFSLFLQIILLCVISFLLSGCPEELPRVCDCGEEEFSLNLYIKDSNGNILTDAGNIEVFPEGPYKKGQMVVIVFTPEDGYTFVRWKASVSENYADQYGLNTVSNFPSPNTVFIMSGDTNITAIVEGEKTLTVRWKKEVYLPENPYTPVYLGPDAVNINGGREEEIWEEEFAWKKRKKFNYAEMATINAISVPGHLPLWEMRSLSLAGDTSIWCTENVTVQMFDNCDLYQYFLCPQEVCCFGCYIPENWYPCQNSIDLSISPFSSGNGGLYCNGLDYYSYLVSNGYFLSSYTRGIYDDAAPYFAIGIFPEINKSFVWWFSTEDNYYLILPETEYPPEQPPYLPTTHPYPRTVRDNHFSALVLDKVYLNYAVGRVDVAGWTANKGGVVKMSPNYNFYPDSGCCTWGCGNNDPRLKNYGWNPYPFTEITDGYYLTPSGGFLDEILRHKDVYANRIELTAEPCPMHIFDHWEIENGDGQYQNVGDSNPLEIYMNKWESQAGEIHVSPNTNELNVKAVFHKPPSSLIAHGATRSLLNLESEAHNVLESAGFYVTYIDRPPTPEPVLQSLKCHDDIFVFDGHSADGEQLCLQVDGYFTLSCECIDPACTEFDALYTTNVNAYNRGHNYRFVYLFSCYTGRKISTWKDVFNANCVLGFDEAYQEADLGIYDMYFWYYLTIAQENYFHRVSYAANKAWIDTYDALGKDIHFRLIGDEWFDDVF